jgi:porphobilinogen synthase
MYPYSRLRRTRKHLWLRELVAENNLSVNDLVMPIFIVEGHGIREHIETMPGIFRLSIDEAVKLTLEAEQEGIKAIILFPFINEELKNEQGDEGFNPDNLVCRCIKNIKKAGINIGIICDVALDPYTSHGHDGIVINNDVDNDKTIEALILQSLVLVKSGADILAPSDMMDGRIGAIRKALEENQFSDVPIIAYAAKYSSSFYGPFRDALGSKTSLGASDKSSYQMDIRNSREALREVELDIQEGADIILIKPGLLYLDVIKEVSSSYAIPVFAYHVSGEYSMLKFGSMNCGIDYTKALIETLMSFKRAGAKCIITYAALDAAKILNSK